MMQHLERDSETKSAQALHSEIRFPFQSNNTLDPLRRCVHELFAEQAERTPDSVAVVFADQQLTYDELNQRANKLAHYVRQFGVGPEVLVGICGERSLEMIVGVLGIRHAGVA